MNSEQVEQLKVGDKVGVLLNSIGRGESAVVATVTKVTKTRVYTEHLRVRTGSNTDELVTVTTCFTMRGKEFNPSSRYYYSQLCTIEDSVNIRACNRMEDANRVRYRRRMAIIKELSNHINSDEKFATLLQTLNQGEYTV